MSGNETVKGLGPLPKKPPMYRVVGKRPVHKPVDVLKVAVKREAQKRRDAQYPGFSSPELGMDPEQAAKTDVEKARATVKNPVWQGEWVRTAGINVPVRTLYRANGTRKATVYPFGVRKHGNGMRKVIE